MTNLSVAKKKKIPGVIHRSNPMSFENVRIGPHHEHRSLSQTPCGTQPQTNFHHSDLSLVNYFITFQALPTSALQGILPFIPINSTLVIWLVPFVCVSVAALFFFSWPCHWPSEQHYFSQFLRQAKMGTGSILSPRTTNQALGHDTGWLFTNNSRYC